MTERLTETERFLRGSNVIARTSPQTRQVLGCIGCRWFRAVANDETPQVSSAEIRKCQGLHSGTIVPILHRLEGAGLMRSLIEKDNPSALGRPLRRYYSPSSTTEGKDFYAALRVSYPDECTIDSKPDDGTAIERCRAIVGFLTEAREKQMSQTQMATHLSISQPRISQIENSYNPHLLTLMNYAEKLGYQLVAAPFERNQE